MDKAWVGIDIGSVSVDGVILIEDKKVIKDYYLLHKGRPIETVIYLLNQISLIVDIKDIEKFSVVGY